MLLFAFYVQGQEDVKIITENTVEVPTIPKTDKGLKFDVAAQELKKISDNFFKLRNHNFQYKAAMKQIKDKLKNLERKLMIVKK